MKTKILLKRTMIKNVYYAFLLFVSLLTPDMVQLT